MKTFKFTLNTVLKYKEQVLGYSKAEYAKALQAVRECEKKIKDLESMYEQQAKECENRKRNGIDILNLKIYEYHLESLDLQIRREKQTLERLEQRAEEKRLVMVNMKKEAASIGKIKERKYILYNKEVLKQEEQFIEEFVANQRHTV